MGGDIVTVGPATGPVTNITLVGVGSTTTGLGTVPLGPTTNCGAVTAGGGPATNGPDGDPSAFGPVVNPGGN